MMAAAISTLHDWQTLFSGLLALAGAIITVGFLSYQQNQVRKSEETAARSRLPHTLSSLCEYSEQVSDFLLSERLTPPPSPERALDQLYRAVQNVDRRAAKRISQLLRHQQVQMSRLRSTHEGTRDNPEFWQNEHFYDVALLRTYTNSLFDYARYETKRGPSCIESAEDVLRGLRDTVGFSRYLSRKEEFSEVVATIKRRHKSKPWLRPMLFWSKNND